MRMTDTQLAALVELMGGRMSDRMRAAMQAVLVHGKEQKAAAQAFGVVTSALSQRIKLAKKKLRLAYKAITGLEYVP